MNEADRGPRPRRLRGGEGEGGVGMKIVRRASVWMCSLVIAAVMFLPFLMIVLALVSVEFVSDSRPKVRWNMRRAAVLVARFVVDYPSMWAENARDALEMSHD